MNSDLLSDNQDFCVSLYIQNVFNVSDKFLNIHTEHVCKMFTDNVFHIYNMAFYGYV